ncbi:MAG: putative amidophosphoribosyltransferase [Glaciecola sp.]|jgi:predicted amidophosphoribosyltransferase
MFVGEVLAAIAPTRCLVCRRRAVAPWCESCRLAAPAASHGCLRCADPWAGHVCPFRDGEVTATLAAWRWEGSARDVIVGAKARNAWAGWHRHGQTLAQVITAGGWPVSAIVGVPTVSRVARQRGLDHGRALAHATAAALGVPSAAVLRAPKGREDQVTSRRRLRSFAGQRFALEGEIGGEIVLVDDVLTTGATARAAAQALHRGGAQHVRIAVLARGGWIDDKK